MNASQLTAVFPAESSGTAVGSPEHAAIILPLTLILLVGTVLLIGSLLVLLVRRCRRTRGAGLFGGEGGQSQASLRGNSNRFFQSSIFQCPSRWVAIKTANPRTVQAALGLHNPTPCSWTEGMTRVNDQKLFVSPPVNGWVLVVGSLLPEPSEDVDACFRFLQRLSHELGEVQFFSVNRAVGHHAWARFERGRAVRGFAWAGETLWNQGRKTWAELKLGLRCPDYGEGAGRNHFEQVEWSRGNAEKVPLLASIWSLDPSAIDDNALSDAIGITGDLSPAKLR